MSISHMARTAASCLVARLNLKSERGASAVEYGIMVSMIAAVIILAVIFLGRETSRTFSCAADSLPTSTNAC